MKAKLSFLSLGLLLGLGLNSCSSTEDVFIPEEQQVEIKLTSAILTPETRGANASEQSTQIISGQAVGVTIANASAAHDNVQWNVGANGALTSTSTSPIYYGATAATITAYHPYNAAWSTLTTQQFSVQEDQSADGYKNSDLLWTTKTQERTTESVSLVFAHKLAKVNVNLSGTSFTESELASATVSIANVELNTGIDLSTGALSAATTSNVGEIIAAKNSKTASAIVVPQTVASGKVLIKVKLGSAVYGYTLPSDATFAAGTSYTYNMTLSRTQLSMSSSSITDWTTGATTDVAGEELPSASQEVEPENQYLNITALSDGVNISTRSENVDDIPEVKYSFDKTQWEDLGTGKISLNMGQTVYLKGNNESGFTKEKAFYTEFITTGSVSADGNIMSLLYGDDFIGKKEIPCDYCFNNLFLACKLKHAPILPATVLKRGCYSNMFFSCWELEEAPELPATTLAESCYSSMFWECKSLVDAPELPATTLAKSCYSSMFADCTSLVNAPELPATTLAESCYRSMFGGCWNLEKAPVLPAQTLVTMCYASMFSGCEKLNEVKAYFTSTPVGLSSWLSDTAENGTLYLSKDITWDVNNFTNKSNLNIPDGWTIVKE